MSQAQAIQAGLASGKKTFASLAAAGARSRIKLKANPLAEDHELTEAALLHAAMQVDLAKEADSEDEELEGEGEFVEAHGTSAQ